MTLGRQTGLSLIELMVGLAIGLFLSAGIIQVFSANKQANRFLESATRQQENVRLAIDIVTEQLRSAGFAGCISDPELRVYILANSEPNLTNVCTDDKCYPADMLDIETVTSGTGPLPYGLPDSSIAMPVGSVAIGFYQADPANCAAMTSTNLSAGSSSLSLSPPNNFGTNPYLLLANCSGVSILQVSGNTKPTDGDDVCDVAKTQTLALSGFASSSLPFEFPVSTDVYKLTGSLFYVACQSSDDSDCALYYDDDIDDALAPQELVQGIADMRARYGVDTDNPADGAADIFVYDPSSLTIAGVADPWHRVISLQIAFLTVSDGDNLADSAVSYDFPPATWSGTATVTPSDRRIRRVYTTSVALRNRIANFRNNL